MDTKTILLIGVGGVAVFAVWKAMQVQRAAAPQLAALPAVTAAPKKKSQGRVASFVAKYGGKALSAAAKAAAGKWPAAAQTIAA
jgi:predicted negative regulator of RcsB-dependent stress response